MFSEFDDCFQWKCDKCGLTAEFAPGDFYRALGELKARGWGIVRDDDGWAHYCAKHKRSAAQILDMPSNKLRGSG
jgi:hypothetical protein